LIRSREPEEREEPMAYEPKFELAEYRKFIRDAAPFVSLVLGRKIKPAEADLLSDTEMLVIAEKIDLRVKDLNANIEANKKHGLGSKPVDKPE
jgi:hypothetical protein